MSKINPLHLLALLGVIILFLFFQLATLKQELHEEKSNLQQSKVVAIDLENLKRQYGDKKRVKYSLQRILSQHSYEEANISAIYEQNVAVITAKSLSLQILNAFMSRVINGTYVIKSLEIKRIDTHHARLRLEIKW